MGAITFSLDARLVGAIRSHLPLSVLVETGTFKGDTVDLFLNQFREIISIELSKSLSMDAAKRFEHASKVTILEGSSAEKLDEIALRFQSESVLFWLDAHWCVANDTAGELSQCPLLDEIKAIGKLNSNSVLLIDDARLFLAPPLSPHEISHWPTFQEIINALRALSKQHEVMVVNDVITFFPAHIRNVMESYAQTCGIDWLMAANSYRYSSELQPQIEEKEKVIQQLIVDRDECLKLIAEQNRTINAYRAAYGGLYPLRILARATRRFREILAPRLGNLNQYAPRTLTTKKNNSVLNLQRYPKISITTPSFGQGKFIERTLISVLEQKYPNLEYFVQDGGSTDETVEILKKYQKNLTAWASEKDTGQSQAINLGFERSSGEIMAWLNSDDLLLPGALDIVAGYFNNHPDVDVVYGNRLMIDESDREIGRWIMPGHDSKVLSWVDYIPQETMFWRRSIWDRVGGNVDESFRFAMDWDLLVRFRDAGAKFAHIPRFMGAFRIHEHQKTSATINDIGHLEMNRIRKRILSRSPSRKELLRAIAPFLLKHLFFDMVYRVKSRIGINE